MNTPALDIVESLQLLVAASDFFELRRTGLAEKSRCGLRLVLFGIDRGLLPKNLTYLYSRVYTEGADPD